MRTRNGLAVLTIATFALVPSPDAANATATAWLPALTVVTPCANCSGPIAMSADRQPRG
jgi:hypothetical protein